MLTIRKEIRSKIAKLREARAIMHSEYYFCHNPLRASHNLQALPQELARLIPRRNIGYKPWNSAN